MLVAQPSGRGDVVAESLVLTVVVASLSYRFVERPVSALFRRRPALTLDDAPVSTPGPPAVAMSRP